MKKFDLIFERKTNLAQEQLWKAWTHPETLMKWFCPRPWRVTRCELELKAGGRFYTRMEGPQGESVDNEGCYLEVVPHKKLVWTNMMSADYQPHEDSKMGFSFAVILELIPDGSETLYKATVRHANEEGMKKHLAMGFQEGWGMAFNQLLELH